MDSRTKSKKKMVPTHEIRPPGSKKHVEIINTTPFLKKSPKLTKVYELVIFFLFPFKKVLFPFKKHGRGRAHVAVAAQPVLSVWETFWGSDKTRATMWRTKNGLRSRQHDAPGGIYAPRPSRPRVYSNLIHADGNWF